MFCPVLSQSLAFPNQVLEKCRGLPVVHIRKLGLVFPHLLQQLGQANLVRLEHRPSLVGREAIPVHKHSVNIRGLGGDTLLQNFETLVDQGVKHASEDLLIGEGACRARCEAVLAAVLLQERLKFRVRLGYKAPTRVFVPPLACLHTQTICFCKHVNQPRPPLLLVLFWEVVWICQTKLLADLVADVVAGNVPGLEGARRVPELPHHPVHPGGGAALLDQVDGLEALLEEGAVAHEPVAVPHQHGHLADALGHVHDDRHRGIAGPGPQDDLAQAHQVGGREEVHAQHLVGAGCHTSNLIDVKRRGV
mmetsp:Transcript_3077/g.5081  ORF Transcript_3077/g.5081 Transcript_3077/m.5081 type:complete len:306 (-) Transcript_3077:763-1680(-)